MPAPDLATLTVATGCLAGALSLAVSVPQVWTTCVRGRTAGLPASRFWLSALQSLCWLVYGVVAPDPTQVVVNLVCGAMAMALLAAVLRGVPGERRTVAPWTGVTAGWLVLCAGGALLDGPVAVGVLGALVGLGVHVPQLLHLLRHPGAATDGVSRAATLVAMAAAAAWATYGGLRGELLVLLPAAVGLVLLTWSLVALRRAGAPAEVVLPVPRADAHDVLRLDVRRERLALR